MSQVDHIAPAAVPEPRFARIFDLLCPMHVMLTPTGHVAHLGPTAQRLFPDEVAAGRRFLELFELKRPRIGSDMADLRAAEGMKLHLRLRRPPCTDLKGVLVTLNGDAGPGLSGDAVVNLSFGISIVEAVRSFDLCANDFAATDLALEMLYLVEAKSAAMEASHKLNLRLEGARIAAEEQAFTDTLTGLKNRRAMALVLARLTETRRDFALLHVDLDHFKQVNDTRGHAAGDFILQTVARIMVEETRREDTVVRTGGDEFVIILGDAVDPDRVRAIARRLIARIEQPMLYRQDPCRISASIGATLSHDYPQPCIERMMADADAALYAAKAAGRGQVRLSD